LGDLVKLGSFLNKVACPRWSVDSPEGSWLVCALAELQL
jgi:hypothetical protein